MLRVTFFLIFILPGLLFAEHVWPPLEVKPVQIELSTSFSSFFPSDNPIPELTIKMLSTWRIKLIRITEHFLELELILKSGLEKNTKGETEVKQAVGHVIPPEEQIPYFTLLNRPILIRILPQGNSNKGTFEIVDPKSLNPIPHIAQQQKNLIKVLLLFFPFQLNTPLLTGAELMRSGDEMSFKITSLEDSKIFASVLDYRELPVTAPPSKMLYSKRKRWGSLVWNRQNILICRGEVFSEREFETEKRLPIRISASASISSKLLVE